MKRDMDLVRDILLEMEKHDAPGTWPTVTIEGHPEQEINYHMVLMKGAGLIEAAVMDTRQGPIVQPLRLTWGGHEFLDSARSSKVWNGAKDLALKTTGTLTLEGLKLAIPVVMKLLMGA
jgi:hypothetical protein